MTLHNTVNAMLHSANGCKRLNRVLTDVVWMMIENADIDAIAQVLQYLPEEDAIRILEDKA